MHLCLCILLMIVCRVSTFKLSQKILSSNRRMLSSLAQENVVDKRLLAPNQVIVLSGATSVGKSAVSMELCKILDAEIVIADSVQVYKHMNIGSNKPTLEDQSVVRHHLIDVHDTSTMMTAGDFAKMAVDCIRDIQSRGKTPIVVGGSLMWINWLTNGMPDAPAATQEIIQRTQELIGGFEDVQDWHSALSVLMKYDPILGKKVEDGNWYRLRRYLEIALALQDNHISNNNSNNNGNNVEEAEEVVCSDNDESEGNKRTLTGQRTPFLPDCDIRHFFVTEYRDNLYRVIDERCELMLQMGLIKEVAELMMSGVLSPSLTVTRAIGYRQTIDYLLRHDFTPNDVQAATQYLQDFCTATRNYASSQIKYHRKEPTSLFIRMERTENLVRQPFETKTESALSPVKKLVNEVLHWCSVSREEFSHQITTQKINGTIYGDFATKRKPHPAYSIENNSDNENPEIIRQVLCHLVATGLLKIPKTEFLTSEQKALSWATSIYDASKGVTPDTIKQVNYEWTAQEMDIRAVEVRNDLMKRYTSKIKRPEVLSALISEADHWREVLFTSRPDVVENFYNNFNRITSGITRKVN